MKHEVLNKHVKPLQLHSLLCSAMSSGIVMALLHLQYPVLTNLKA